MASNLARNLHGVKDSSRKLNVHVTQQVGISHIIIPNPYRDKMAILDGQVSEFQIQSSGLKYRCYTIVFLVFNIIRINYFILYIYYLF